MTIRTYILLAYLLIVGGGFYYLINRNIEELAPRYLESMEEAIVDNVNILASVIESETQGDRLDPAGLRTLFDGAFHRRFNAPIYSLTKTRVNARVYVTDAQGAVIYDSQEKNNAEGEDYSRWHDVHETLEGRYGARSSRENPENPLSLTLYMAAPIRSKDGARPIGVVAIGKPAESINELVGAARRRMAIAGLAGAGMILLLGVAFSMWVTSPITRLTQYARAVRDGRAVKVPRLAGHEGREVRELREAFEEMRAAIEGKDYVERYVQTLTHEIKSPLSAIRGAAEILGENPPVEARARFLGNIKTEAGRIQRIVDQLLQLASLEARKAHAKMAALDLTLVARETINALQPVAQAAGIELALDAPPAPVTMRGDRALLGQALGNLLQNALEFTPSGGRVVLRVGAGEEKQGVREVVACIEDSGSGIPDYAAGRLFEKFYSLARPRSGVKSTGLGLSLVREIAHLHGGDISVANRPAGEKGARAELRFPQGRMA
jgi:two-component system sensor histidine kinase CreC